MVPLEPSEPRVTQAESRAVVRAAEQRAQGPPEAAAGAMTAAPSMSQAKEATSCRVLWTCGSRAMRRVSRSRAPSLRGSAARLRASRGAKES